MHKTTDTTGQSSNKELEALLWWRLSSEACAAIREKGATAEELPLLRDEAEAIVMHSPWPKLRQIAAYHIGVYDAAVAGESQPLTGTDV